MNTTTATFRCGATATRTPPIWQYDYGQILKFAGIELPTAYEVHFSDHQFGESTTQIGNSDGVTIPDSYLTTGRDVYAWVYLHEEETDGETVYMVIIPVRKRASITEETPTPVEESAITQAIVALNEAVILTDDYRTEAESWAVGGTGTRENEDYDNAKFYSEVAQQGADASGFAFFDVNLADGEMYVTVSDSLSQELSFAVDETTGNLEVTIE